MQVLCCQFFIIICMNNSVVKMHYLQTIRPPDVAAVIYRQFRLVNVDLINEFFVGLYY